MIDLKDSIENTVHTVLYILKQLGGKADLHKVFKIMYFADQRHLLRFGSTISSDTYIAMANGPVPSITYDILKALRGEGLLIDKKANFEPYFKLEKRSIVSGIMDPDLDCLSKSEIQVLNEAIYENKDLDFSSLTEKSHDFAWNQALSNGEMDLRNIAKAVGADDDMLRYIGFNIENSFSTLG